MKSNSKTLTLIATSLILFIPAYFLIPFPHKNNATFYLVFVSTILAFLFQFYAFAYVYKKRAKVIKNNKTPILYVSYMFLSLSLLLMLILSIINAYLSVSLWITLLLEILLFGFYILGIVAVNEGYVYSDIDEIGNGDGVFMVELRDDIKALLSNFRHPILHNKLESLTELIIMSYPTYNIENKEIEAEIAKNYKILKDAYYDNDMNLVDQQIDKVMALVTLRNKEIINKKNEELANQDVVM